MPIVGIKDCGGGPPKSGIPVRLPPQNICDVNPYVCRMTPASIDFKSDPPFVGKLSFEPHPRGCQCCSKAARMERESYQRSSNADRQYRLPSPPRASRQYQTPAYKSLGLDMYERPVRETSIPMQTPSKRSFQEGPPEQSRTQSRTSQQQAQYRGSQQPGPSTMPPEPSGTSPQPEPGRTSVQPFLTKKQRKMQMKNEKKFAKMERQREKRLSQQQRKQSKASQRSSDYERVRLLREQKRRDDFVTACCNGLLLTPCVSAGSCSEEADEREQANFYIQCKCCPAETKNVCGNPATNNVCGNEGKTRRSRKRADFPCQCRNCKYQNKGCTNQRTGCLEEATGESPVCYCTDEEKIDDRPHRVCGEQPYQRGARAGQRGFYAPGDGTVCDEMMPTRAALLTCNKEDGDGACTKMVMTAELMQDMLIKQAQQGIQLANSLLTNKKFQLVDVTVPGYENIPPGQVEGYRSQPIQTSRTEQRSQNAQTGSSRSTQPVELNDTNLKCYLQNIDPPDVTLPAGSETGQNRLGEPLPRPPLNPYQSEPYQDDYYKMNSMAEAEYQSRTHPYRHPEETTGTTSYHESIGSTKQSRTNIPSNPSYTKMNTMGEYHPSPQFRQPEGTTQAGHRYPTYQGPTGAAIQLQGTTGITGHICIPRDALLQDPTNPKLCIPLSFDPRLSMGSANCPFVSDHAEAEGSAPPEPGYMAGSSSQRTLRKGDSRQQFPQGSHRSVRQGLEHDLQKGDSQQRLKQGSHQSLTQGLQRGLQKEASRQREKPDPYNAPQQHGSRQGLVESSHQGIHKESSKTGQQDPKQDTSGMKLQERSSTRIRRSSKHRDSDRDRRRKDSDRERHRTDSDRERRRRESDRERRGRRPDRERRRRESDSSPERTRRRSKQMETPKQRPYRESVNHDDKPTDRTTKQRRKRSISPCVDSDGANKKRDSGRRPSPSEMVRTLNGYETDLLQAMDKVKGKYAKKRGNETSSSKGSSFDSMTPGLAEFNCLLKHITCLRKELKKYSNDT